MGYATINSNKHDITLLPAAFAVYSSVRNLQLMVVKHISALLYAGMPVSQAYTNSNGT